jgi:APA family basic amino acid/polyamine antiporter
MSGLPGETWLRLLLWMGAGLVVYAAYGRRHSKVQRHS